MFLYKVGEDVRRFVILPVVIAGVVSIAFPVYGNAQSNNKGEKSVGEEKVRNRSENKEEDVAIEKDGDEEEDIPSYYTNVHDFAEIMKSVGKWNMLLGYHTKNGKHEVKDKEFYVFQAVTEGVYSFEFSGFVPVIKRRPESTSKVYFEVLKIAEDTHSVQCKNELWHTVQILDDTMLFGGNTIEKFTLQAGEKLYTRVRMFNCDRAIVRLNVELH